MERRPAQSGYSCSETSKQNLMTQTEKALLKRAIKDIAYQAFRLLVLITSIALFWLVVFGLLGTTEPKW